MQPNPLRSKEGFSYLFSLISQPLGNQTINTLYSELIDQELYIQGSTKKNSQIKGILNCVELGQYGRIEEVACGKAKLARQIGKNFPSLQIIATDNNTRLLESIVDHPSNVSFETKNLFLDSLSNADLYISLHGCGSISDQLLIKANDKGGDIICVPCCYGKINTNHTPLSSAMKVFEGYFQSSLSRLQSLEGSVKMSQDNVSRKWFDVLSLMINSDRAKYLEEQNYQVKIVALTKRKTKDKKNLTQSPHRFAIVATAR